MSKRHLPIFSIAMYALSVLLAAYAAWAFIHCWRDIAEATAAGQLAVRGNEFEIASFYMANSLQYAVWAALLFSAGWVARRPPALVRPAPTGLSPVSRKEDEEFDKWFEELRSHEGAP